MQRRRSIRAWRDYAEPYALKQARKSVWRLQYLGYSEEDIVQEAYLAYDRCLTLYGTIFAGDALSLEYKASVRNLISSLSVKDSKEREGLKEYKESEYIAKEGSPFANSNFFDLLRKAPIEVKEVLSLVFNTPQELLEEVTGSLKSSRGFNDNKFLCEQLGYNRFRVNLVKITKRYFSGNL